MKISDERLAELIRRSWHGTMQELSSALTELQQLREERRWRKISEEKPKRKDGNAIVVIWKDDALKQPVSMFFKNGTWWDADDGFYVDEDTIAYWRPLPTDLPGEE